MRIKPDPLVAFTTLAREINSGKRAAAVLRDLEWNKMELETNDYAVAREIFSRAVASSVDRISNIVTEWKSKR